jgi:hypothetical protein
MLLATIEAVLVDIALDIAVLTAAVIIGLLTAVVAISVIIMYIAAIIAVLAGVAGGSAFIAVSVSIACGGIGHTALGTILVIRGRLAALIAFSISVVFLIALQAVLIRKTFFLVFSTCVFIRNGGCSLARIITR